jgi:hypothetical protein
LADWIIKSRNESTHRTCTDTRNTEEGFLTLVGDIFSNPRRKLISATLPSGEVLDKVAVRAGNIMAATSSPSWRQNDAVFLRRQVLTTCTARYSSLARPEPRS